MAVKTLDDVKNCPKCGYEGKVVRKDKGPRPGSFVTTFNCVTKSCRWFETGWVIQHDTEGNVYERENDGHARYKQFPMSDENSESRAKRMIEEAEGW